ncbi:MAG TPA: NADH-quinone oxidoreductase subunit L [Candidatus Limnocylindria bacterium]|jgi:NADH-quinone oxidoreductase subunit L
MTLLLLPALPLAGALVIALVGGPLGRRMTGAVGTAAIVLAFGAALSLVPGIADRPRLDVQLGPWLPLPGADLSLVLEGAGLALTLMVTGVSALIALYSIGYLPHGPGAQRYFAALDLFVAAMLLVVLAGNLVLLFAGWELVGLCSYLLIGHERERAAAGAAALKAFVVNRVGDAAFLVGIFLFAATANTVDLAELRVTAIEHLRPDTATAFLVASALLLVGALAKSAQLPLHTWLPDAMEGPTPVSALIHAATMVTAGVVLLIRLRAILAPEVLLAAAIIGAVTALFAALVAMAQRDLKRVLAWSTISQVGLMFVAAGLGAVFAALFHLLAHAFFKATLFLGAGTVIHATGEQDLALLGGLGRRMRPTAVLFGIGALGLAAIPPASGFFSKEAIAVAALDQPALLAAVLLTSALSAFYAARLFTLVFLAPAAGATPVHGTPAVMVIPLTLLAILTLGFGALVGAHVVPLGLGREAETPGWLVAVSIALGLGGAVAGWQVYRRGLPAASRVERVTGRAAGGFGVDRLYRAAFAAPLNAVARDLGRGAERANELAIDGLAALVGRGGDRMRRLQAGPVRGYEALLLTGAVILLAFWSLR